MFTTVPDSSTPKLRATCVLEITFGFYASILLIIGNWKLKFLNI